QLEAELLDRQEEQQSEAADRELCLRLASQEQEEDDSKQRGKAAVANSNELGGSLVDPNWELVDPTPNVHALFLDFNGRYFGGSLVAVEVKWSPRMTLCAGLCCYEGRGGLCCIKLSEPLLKLRPRRDLVETLLHEMIHAHLFVTANNRDRDGHGPQFLAHMRRINSAAGTNITVYHSFHDEVAVYKQHWWRCEGPCRNRPPFHGWVRRSMNRAPGPNDTWWRSHQADCGGRFVKVKEPEGFADKKKPLAKKNSRAADGGKDEQRERPAKRPAAGQTDIRQFIPASPASSGPDPSVGSVESKSWRPAIAESDGAVCVASADSVSAAVSAAVGTADAAFPGVGIRLGGSGGSSSYNNVGGPGNGVGGALSRVGGALKGVGGAPNGIGGAPNGVDGALKGIGGASNGLGGAPNGVDGGPKGVGGAPNGVSGTLNGVGGAASIGAVSQQLVSCPVCSRQMPESDINVHLDLCLSS
ncbi:hypothetical protein BOX15_Mlig032306g2, partial [Macrostomum lignano]